MLLLLLACRADPPQALDEAPDDDTAVGASGDTAAEDTGDTAGPAPDTGAGADSTDTVGVDTGAGGDSADPGLDTAEPPARDDDGDGYTLADGDCDDADAATFPDAPEVAGDAVDQDCDDLVDEVEACGTGGDHATIQEAVDAAPDGGVVEICAGVWDAEMVDLRTRSLELVGGGDDPADVILAYPSVGVGDPLLYVGGTASLALRRMVLQPTYYALYGSLERVELEAVEVEGGTGVAVWGDYGVLEADVSASHFSSTGLWFGGGDWYEVSADLDTNVFEDTIVGMDGTVPGGHLQVENNLFLSSALTTTAETASVSGNTFVGGRDAYTLHGEAVDCDYSYMGVYTYCSGVPALALADNLFVSTAPTSALIDFEGYFYTPIASADTSDLHPSSASGNVLWDIDGTLFQMHYMSVVDIWSWDACDLYDTSWSTTLDAASGWTDPGFTSVAGYGSYYPSATPAVGAFAGGDWTSFPWTIP